MSDKLIAEMRLLHKSGEVELQPIGLITKSQAEQLCKHIDRCSPDNIVILLDRIATLEAENERLREALTPFANFISSRTDPATGTFNIMARSSVGKEKLTVDDCRRAQKALDTGHE